MDGPGKVICLRDRHTPGDVTNRESEDSMANQVTLPLSLNTVRNFQSFFTGLEDGKVRAGLKAQPGLDKSVLQLLDLIEDKKFLKMASKVANHLYQATPSTPTNFALDKPVATTPGIDLHKESASIRDYMESKYPDAVTLLRDYGKTAIASGFLPKADTVGANVDVAANAEAVVNAAVWANVAVATQAVVAAAVVAVVGAVVV